MICGEGNFGMPRSRNFLTWHNGLVGKWGIPEKRVCTPKVTQTPPFAVNNYCTNLIEAELMQNRNPVGAGPSGKTWPKWQSHTLHSTSMRVIPKLLSLVYLITLDSTGCVKLGQPLLDSNFVRESKSTVPQHRHV